MSEAPHIDLAAPDATERLADLIYFAEELLQRWGNGQDDLDQEIMNLLSAYLILVGIAAPEGRLRPDGATPVTYTWPAIQREIDP